MYFAYSVEDAVRAPWAHAHEDLDETGELPTQVPGLGIKRHIRAPAPVAKRVVE